MNQIERFQDIMLLARKATGWTADELAARVGVTRQTINNIEANKPEKFKLTRPMYIAIRSVLDEEIRSHPDDTKLLQSILQVFVDEPEKYSEEDRNQFRKKAEMLAPSILANTSTRTEVSEELAGIIAPLVSIATLLVTGIATNWLRKLLDDK